MNYKQLTKIVLKGFRSIQSCNLELQELNVLIGCNGAGKSNFIGFFKMIQQMLDQNLQAYVGEQGGPDALLHFGRKKTDAIEAELYFGDNGYQFSLSPTADNRMMYKREAFYWIESGSRPLGSGHFETKAYEGTRTHIDSYVRPALEDWRVYHFHDTSSTALVKQKHGINENVVLLPDARNLAAFLYLLQRKYEENYIRIVKTIQLAAPFFGNFVLRPDPHNESFIQLEWKEKGQNTIFSAEDLSDGTLRFICLATLLLQPEEKQPATILIDEPELGLHPFAIRVLAAVIKAASKKKQVIISTQSVELLNEFKPEDVIVADRIEHRSVFRRLGADELAEWLGKDYSLGELWKKNVLGGRPAR